MTPQKKTNKKVRENSTYNIRTKRRNQLIPFTTILNITGIEQVLKRRSSYWITHLQWDQEQEEQAPTRGHHGKRKARLYDYNNVTPNSGYIVCSCHDRLIGECGACIDALFMDKLVVDHSCACLTCPHR